MRTLLCLTAIILSLAGCDSQSPEVGDALEAEASAARQVSEPAQNQSASDTYGTVSLEVTIVAGTGTQGNNLPLYAIAGTHVTDGWGYKVPPSGPIYGLLTRNGTNVYGSLLGVGVGTVDRVYGRFSGTVDANGKLTLTLTSFGQTSRTLVFS